MLIIVAGSGRSESKSFKVALHYRKLLSDKGIETDLLSLEELPDDIIFHSLKGQPSQRLDELIDSRVKPHEKLIFIMPEFNGSFPGLLKLFLDACDKDLFRGKKAALIGISAGRAGNLRGMDHLTNILHHIGIEVLSNKIPISSIDKIITTAGFENEETEKVLIRQIDQFLKF